MSENINIVARRIFNRLDEDIEDRIGLKDEWVQISPQIKNDGIRRAWEKIFTEEIEKHTAELQARATTLESERTFFENANKGMIQDQCDDEAKIHALCLRVGIPESELEGGECFYFGIYEHAERMALEIELLQSRVKRLEEACSLFQQKAYFEAMKAWKQAKESKP